MEFGDLKIGKLYCFPTRAKSCFSPFHKSLYLMPENSVFVLLESEYNNTFWGDNPVWVTLKILDSNGEIWYTDLNLVDFKFMEECKP
jgi:hypothetical protein